MKMIARLTEKAFLGFRFPRTDPVAIQTVRRVNERICKGVAIA